MLLNIIFSAHNYINQSMNLHPRKHSGCITHTVYTHFFSCLREHIAIWPSIVSIPIIIFSDVLKILLYYLQFSILRRHLVDGYQKVLVFLQFAQSIDILWSEVGTKRKIAHLVSRYRGT